MTQHELDPLSRRDSMTEQELIVGKRSEAQLIEHAELEAIQTRRIWAKRDHLEIPWQSVLIEGRG